MKLVNENRDFVPAPAGLHKAVCVDIVDLGMQTGFGGKQQHKVRFYWELPDAPMDDGRPFIVTRMFTATLNEKGSLNPFLSKWRGGVQIKEGEAIDLDDFLLKSASVFVSHNTKESGKVYANVDLAMPCNERVRPSGYYKRKDPAQSKQSGSAVHTPGPVPSPIPRPVQSQPVTPVAGRTASQSTDPLPKTDELYREGALGITGKIATQEQKDKFLALLLPIKENAAKYFNSLGALGNDQPLDALPLQYCPATKAQFDNVMASIQTFIDAQPETDQSVPF